ncbi:MAG: LysR family transcriptional regulator [Eubacteriales bacterium]|nr:LysR family transcriptional regulator [Eubacteriales bacterium]
MFQGMEYVYEVYKERSFSRAAANLFISQPSLSANVKRIEKRIGYPIFDRSTKPLGLTECGQRYIRSIEQILSVENEFSNFVNDWGELKTGNLILGGSSFFSSWVLPPLIGDFARRYPQVKMVLIEENTAKLAELLQTGRMDFMLDNCELDEAVFDRCIFQEEHLLLAVPQSFAVNQTLTDYQVSMEDIQSGSFLSDKILPVPMESFADLPFILMKPENDTGKRAISICQENHFHPQIAFELDQQMTSYNVTCSGMGISFIGDLLLLSVPANSSLVYYKLPGKNTARNIYFYWKKGRYLSRAMEEFLKLI